jgi:transposase
MIGFGPVSRPRSEPNGGDVGWSNGPVEGQINRLKAIKRQMYGRAKLDLLERRFLPAA